MISRSALLAAISVVVAPQAASQTAAPRSVVPIREVVIPDEGGVRYAIVMTVNGERFEVGLDTGSTGLRLLPRAVRQARLAPGDQTERYAYGSGVLLVGRRAIAEVGLGAALAAVPLHAVESVTCVLAKSHCPASRISPQAYGLMGSGRPGAGFPAIVGIRLQEGRIPNPMAALGVHRWIVHLPQRGQSDGLLILNPDKRDAAGFVALRNGRGAAGTVGACLMATLGGERICGPTLLDTGAPGLIVKGSAAPRNWTAGVPARVAFAAGDGGAAPSVTFRTGDRLHGGNATFARGAEPQGVKISAGTLPFYAFDVLFDGDRGTIAVRPSGTAGPAALPSVDDSFERWRR